MKNKWVLGTILLVAVLGVGRLILAQPARQAVISEIRGGVEIRIREADWKPAEVGVVLHEQDEIRTAKGGFAEILLDENASAGKLELKGDSHLKLSSLAWDPISGEKTTLLDLAIGKVLVHAEKLQGNSQFKVRTATSTTGVRGTVFEVSVTAEK